MEAKNVDEIIKFYSKNSESRKDATNQTDNTNTLDELQSELAEIWNSINSSESSIEWLPDNESHFIHFQLLECMDKQVRKNHFNAIIRLESKYKNGLNSLSEEYNRLRSSITVEEESRLCKLIDEYEQEKSWHLRKMLLSRMQIEFANRNSSELKHAYICIVKKRNALNRIYAHEAHYFSVRKSLVISTWKLFKEANESLQRESIRAEQAAKDQLHKDYLQNQISEWYHNQLKFAYDIIESYETTQKECLRRREQEFTRLKLKPRIECYFGADDLEIIGKSNLMESEEKLLEYKAEEEKKMCTTGNAKQKESGKKDSKKKSSSRKYQLQQVQ
ncbi:hypothetical protein HK098_005413 [Nowakowskiella sp. JEL0407]|nr:hypothetical protein HK098_005413 [Nowakowskiella sp. JEL0407]